MIPIDFRTAPPRGILLAEESGAKPVDAVSMATKDTDDAAEKAAVEAFVGRVR